MVLNGEYLGCIRGEFGSLGRNPVARNRLVKAALPFADSSVQQGLLLSGFLVYGLGFRLQGLGLRVYGLSIFAYRA